MYLSMQKQFMSRAFSQRSSHMHEVNLPDYDFHLGIITPGLFDVAIGFLGK